MSKVSHNGSRKVVLAQRQHRGSNTADLESIPGPIQKQPVNNTIIHIKI
jgi:hypothetical protein